MSISFFLYGPLIDAAYNPNYEGSFLICIMSLGQLFNGFYETLVKFWNLEEKNYKTAVVSIVSAVFNLVVTFLSVYFTRQYIWAAAITCFTLFVRMIVVSLILRKKWAIKIKAKTIITTLTASILMVAVVCCFLYFVGSNVWLLVASVFLGVFVFLTFMFLAGEMEPEKEFLKTLFKKKSSVD